MNSYQVFLSEIPTNKYSSKVLPGKHVLPLSRPAPQRPGDPTPRWTSRLGRRRTPPPRRPPPRSSRPRTPCGSCMPPPNRLVSLTKSAAPIALCFLNKIKINVHFAVAYLSIPLRMLIISSFTPVPIVRGLLVFPASLKRFICKAGPFIRKSNAARSGNAESTVCGTIRGGGNVLQ